MASPDDPALAERHPFLADFLPFQEEIAYLGMINSLAQTVLKLCAPGVPDVYQGCESWRFSLVDPDNRRPVDYARLARVQDSLVAAGVTDVDAPVSRDLVRELVASWKDGRLKQYVVARALALRREVPEVFARGEYLPIDEDVSAPGPVLAFGRRLEDQLVTARAPLRPARSARTHAALDDGAEATSLVELALAHPSAARLLAPL